MESCEKLYGLGPKEILEHILNSVIKITEVNDLKTLLSLLSDMAHKLVPSDRCTVWVYDSKRKVLCSEIADGVDRIEISSSMGISSYAFMTGIPLIVNDPYNDSRFNSQTDKSTGYNTKNIIAIPLKNSKGETIGVFQALNKLSEEGFTDSDLNMLYLVTVYIAREVDAALLREEINSTQREIIHTLAETGEMRSKETGNHVKRVAEYCTLLAKEVGLSETQQNIIRISSPLHDIGKIAIPDAILLKPGKFEPHERKIMETHAALGYDMLKHSERVVLKAAATIAVQHHEKWDGTGYPAGLAGEQIHIYGRIAALADVFDALGSDRCYKKAWEFEKIVNLFRNESGKHFDPQLAEIFLDNQQSFKDIGEKYKDEF
ncbi:response regulator [Chitinispirillum alkaliphilum]|nr:response regulator [Chitinispirillum alkaliphilum]